VKSRLFIINSSVIRNYAEKVDLQCIQSTYRKKNTLILFHTTCKKNNLCISAVINHYALLKLNRPTYIVVQIGYESKLIEVNFNKKSNLTLYKESAIYPTIFKPIVTYSTY